MRVALFPVMFLLITSILRSQQLVDPIDVIKDKIEIIENYATSEEISLDPEEFLTEMPDHGAELIGYYERDQLRKIIRKIGFPTAMIITTYYFSADQLIYVLYEQKEYGISKNPDGSLLVDYANTTTKYKAHHYFQVNKKLKKEEGGTPLKDIEPENIFIKFAKSMKRLLDNKYENREVYQQLQGHWRQMDYEENVVIFEETSQLILRNKKFFGRRRVTIAKDIMFCSSLKDKLVYKYKIVSISKDTLVLQDLQNQSEKILTSFVKEQ